MTTLRGRLAAAGATLALLAGLLAGAGTPVAAAPGAAVAASVSDGMPNQQWADLPSTDPSSSGQAGWGDMAGGVASRPYVRSLTVINGDVATPVVVDGTTAGEAVAAGQVTTVVSPVNLCRIGQEPSAGTCYATPNRVSLTVGYAKGDFGVGYDFAAPTEEVTPAVGPDTVIDMTVALNTLGSKLRWSWVNGDLEYWRTTNLGRDDATVRIRFKPATAPYLAQWPDGTGCTATPIFNCDIAQADAEFLSATMLFSLDNTLDAALTGAVFATRNAISGYLRPVGTADGPILDIQAASTHTRSDETLQLGTIEAFLPAAALVNMYGVLPADAPVAFATTRSGSAGTNDPPTYRTWTAGTHGSDGLLVTVDDITFSVPKYRVRDKLPTTPSRATAKGGRTVLTATVSGCSRRSPCRAAVYDLGRGGAARYLAGRTLVLGGKTVTASRLSLTAPSAKLAKGDRYLLVVRSTRTGRPLASTVGTVR